MSKKQNKKRKTSSWPRKLAPQLRSSSSSYLHVHYPNRFYVGSSSAIRERFGSRTWAKPTLEEALEHARELLQQNGQEQFVVQIIRVVRMKPVQTIIEG